jgi:RHS repeat-associated protein
MKNKIVFPVNIKKGIILSRIILLTLVSLMSTTAFALHEELRSQSKGEQIAVDSILRNRDPLMSVDLTNLTNALDPTWYNGINMYRVRNRIKLEVNPYVLDACIPDSFTCSVTVRILRLDKDYNLDSVDKTLIVTYHNGLRKLYDAVDVFAFEGYHYVQTKIISVSCGSSIANFLILKNEIDIDRFYDISLSTGPTISSVTHESTTKEIEISWTYISGIVPEEYDLEWTFVDNYKNIGGEFFTASETEYNFRHNSTRVTTSENSYKISAAFERGFLLFRVRAVGRTGARYTYRVNGPWSTTSESGLVSSYPSGSRIEITSVIEHQATLNWQFSATFAEEGKKKEIISYFDGSLRNRQTVTRNNTDTTAIAAETIYDHQGRPAINTLPVPTAQNILKYYADFNLNLSDKPYSRVDFDLDTGSCSPETPAMSINAGSSRYYSVNNPYQSLSNHYKYVPDAFGFAFTQVEYTPDNTGRISRQSGVGLNHVLGSGHETKYFYGTPFQEELDRLFGNSVGYAEHYQKNMVVDANGQVSVSYLNLAGKTIATSLAGGKPTNVDSLSSFVQPQSIKINLQNSSDTSYAEGEIRLSKTFTVTHTNTYTFDYSIEADTFDSECLPGDICLDCVYDLTITLTDICGNNLLDGSVGISGVNLLQRTVGNIGNDFDSACRESALIYSFASDTALNDTINVVLAPGVYTINKVLTINRPAMEFYADVFVRNNTCLKTLDSFETEYLQATDFTGCGQTCDECVASLGGRTTFIATQVALLTEDSVIVTGADSTYLNQLYDSLVATCLEPCNELDVCELNLKILKADISPSGQYALLADNGIFSDSSILSSVCYKYGGNYQYKIVGTTSVKMQYTDGNGNLDSVLYNDVMTAPADLPYDAFVTHFKDSWADSLVQFHPEYCNYEWCVLNHASEVYDQRMLNTETYAKAYDSGYLNPMRMPVTGYGSVKIDPYFNTAWGGLDSTSIKGTMNNYKTEGSTTYNMWQIPLIVFHCDEETTESGINACLSGITMSSPTCAPEQDAMWRMFRALYQAEKKKLVEARMSSQVTCASTSLIKQKRFFTTGDAEDLAATSGASTAAEATDSLKTQCAATCAAYVEIWMFKLRGCNLSSSDSLRLADSLVNICKYGCDVNNPVGASNVAPQYQTGTTPGYKSFQEAVKAIATFMPGICDANLISFPMEFGHDYWATTNPNADTCACNNPVPDSDTACACSETNDDLRIHLLAGIEIPEEEKCKTCINCEKLAQTLSKINVNYNLVLTDTSAGLREIIQNALNAELSFNYNYEDYLGFMSDCLNDTLIQDSTLVHFSRKYRAYMAEPYTPPMGGAALMGGGETLFSSSGIDFGSGSMSSSFSVPVGHKSLDTCACNSLMKYKNIYDSLKNNLLLFPPTLSFSLYMNNNGDCESQWLPTTNPDTLLKRCQQAYEMDDDNIPFSVNRGWSTWQKIGLDQLVDDDSTLFVPEDCACPSYSGGSGQDESYADTVPEERLDCYKQALQHYVFFLMFEKGKQFFDSNGNLTFNSDSIANTLIEAWGPQFPFLSNDTFADPQYFYRFYRQYCPDAPDHVVDSFAPGYYVGPGYGGGSGTGEGYCPSCPPTPIDPCDKCFAPDDNVATAMLGYLNFLTTPYKKANLLTRNGWRVKNETNTFHTNPYLYPDSTCKNSIKHKILYWDPNASPTLSFNIVDTCGYNAVWALNFPSVDAKWKFGNIVAFTDIVGVYPTDCENNSHSFTAKAIVHLGPNYGGGYDTAILMYGYASNLKFYFEEESCTKKYLCNKPLMYAEQDTGDCRTSLTLLAYHNAEVAYNQYIDSVKNAFRAQYIRQCMEARKTEVFTMRYSMQEYHYTLYYYDQAGNLVQTVPPAGVNMLPLASLASVQTARKNNSTPVLPSHTYITKYNFNTLNQLAQQTTPDAGTSTFWYDAVGRLVVSRNAKQNAHSPKQYSYTVFDALGRITEVGQLQSSSAMSVATAFSPSSLASWLSAANSSKEQITRTYYDNVAITGVQTQFDDGQLYLRKRVVSTTYSNTNDGSYQHAVHYSYDVHGYVNTLVREVVALDAAGHRYKRIDYQYDLLSGNVNKVLYQNGHTDRFYHRYQYDADNRIINAYTSPDGVTWDNDAHYDYYRHGPLMRTELGEQKVQGVDYAYTIQGWLKGVNSNTLYTNRDIGQDAYGSGSYPWVAQDVFGYTLGYFDGDYSQVASISTGNHFVAEVGSGSVFNAASANLYNGNIRHMVTTVSVLSGGAPLGSAYRYDQLNRITRAEYYSNIDVANNQWQTTGSMLQAYRNTFTYDANGNILTQNRHGHGTTPNMDSMTYHYQSGTNKLTYVDDVVSSSNYTDDIDDQSSGNYTYDAIGNMISDAAEQIATIEWTVYGKIKTITRTGGSSKSNLAFEYSPDGHRVKKTETPNGGSGTPTTTWYTRDAQGNIMSIYEERNDSIWLEEQELYGSSRLGMVQKKLLLNSLSLDTVSYAIIRGQKRYELSNHLGNVLAVVSDKLIPVCDIDANMVSYFEAEVLYAYDYSPFGAILPQRSYVADTVCTTVIDYDTAYNDHYTLSFVINTLLAPGQTIRIGTAANSKILATYNPGYVTPFSYIAKILMNINPGGDGIEGYNSGSTVIVHFSADSLGFSCGNVVTAYSGTTALTSVSIDCAVDSIYPVDTFTTCSSSDYRFGVNGKEKDSEVKGTGNSYDFGARIYDCRLGRWMSLDVLKSTTPYLSAYNYSKNAPILFIDNVGEDIRIWYKNDKGKMDSWVFNGDNVNDAPNNIFVQKVMQAYSYTVSATGGDEDGNPIKQAACDRKIEIQLIEHSGLGEHSQSSQRNIYWNPNEGSVNAEGIVVSPSIILVHEFDHTYDRIKKPEEHEKRKATKDKDYYNKEEKRVIEGAESKIARKAGEIRANEVTRKDYFSGAYVVVDSPTSNTINKTKTEEFYKKAIEAPNLDGYDIVYERYKTNLKANAKRAISTKKKTVQNK